MASEIKVDTISEKTSGNGVTIDSVSIKDNKVDINGTAGGLILDADADTHIGANTDDVISIACSGTAQVTISDGAISPVTDNDIDLGTSTLEFKNVYVDGTVRTDALDFGTTTMTLPTADGSANQFIKTDGSGTLSFAAAGGDLSFGGDTFGANKVIGANDAYSLSFETGGNTAITIDANGHVTMPLQSSFCATLSSTQSNLAIDDSTVWIEAATEIWDLNGDYNTGTYTFTAPVTGKYHLHARLQMLSTDQAGANQLVFYTSNVNSIWVESFSANMHANDGQRHYHGSVIMDMDANDTAKIRFYQGGGTSQADVNNGQAVSAVSGYLIH